MKDRFSKLKAYWPVLAILLLALIPLYKITLLGEVPGAFREVAATYGKPPSGPMTWDVLQADSVLQTYVWRDLILDQWSRGQAPFWNPFILAGTPLLANSQSGAFYPFHLIAGFGGMSTDASLSLLAYLHLAIFGLGVMKLARAFEASQNGALISGAAAVFAPFCVAWTPIASVMTTCCWIPWLIANLILICKIEPDKKNLTKYANQILFTALSLAMLLLGGHLQFAAYGILAAITVVLCFLVTQKPVAIAISLVLCLGAGVLGAGLAWPQVGATLDFAKNSHRKNPPTNEGWRAYSKSALSAWEFSTFASPDALGLPTQQGSIQQIPTQSTYIGGLLKQGGNYAESALGLACLVPLLAFFQSRKKAKVWLTPLALVILGGLLMTASPLAQFIYFNFPGWSATGSPGRASILWIIGLAVLAGIGFETLTEQTFADKKLSLLLGSLAVFGSAQLVALKPVSNEQINLLVNILYKPASVGLLLAVISVATLGYLHYKKANAQALAATFIALIALSGILAGPKLRSGTPDFAFLQDYASNERTAVLDKEWEIMVPMGKMVKPNLLALSRTPTLGGYDSLMHTDSVLLLKEANEGNDPAPPANGNMMLTKDLAVGPLERAGVSRYIQGGTGSGYDTTSLGGPGVASINDGSLPVNYANFSNYSFRVGPEGIFVFRMSNFPGWSLSVNGQNEKISSGQWITSRVKPDSVIRLSYTPPGHTARILLVQISALCLLLILGFPRVLNLRHKLFNNNKIEPESN